MINKATTAPLSTRYKTMVVRSTVVHLADKRSMQEVLKAGIGFLEIFILNDCLEPILTNKSVSPLD